MAARVYSVAQAVGAAIAAAFPALGATPTVAWMPMVDRPEASVLKCFIVPDRQTPRLAARSQAHVECEVLVGLLKAAADEAEISTLAATLQDISDFLLGRRITSEAVDAHFVSITGDPFFDAAGWNTLKEFKGVLRVTYRVVITIGGGG